VNWWLVKISWQGESRIFRNLRLNGIEVIAIKESSTRLHVETNLKDRAIGIASALVDYDEAKERWAVGCRCRNRSKDEWLPAAGGGGVPRFSRLVNLIFAHRELSSWFGVFAKTGVTADAPIHTARKSSLWLVAGSCSSLCARRGLSSRLVCDASLSQD